MDGKTKDAFEVVLLVFIGAVSSDDLEKKKDYYDHYTNVPIVHFSFAKLTKDEDEMKAVQSYIHKTCEKKLLMPVPLLLSDLSDSAASVSSLIMDLRKLRAHKKEVLKEVVEPAFKKFDLDEKGGIDVAKLRELTKALGQPLS